MNKALSLPILLLLLLIAVLSSCRQVLYFPDRANTPGLTEALEAKATFSIRPNNSGSSSSSSNGNSSTTNNGGVGTSIDLAFSPVEHLGIIGSYRYLSFNAVRNYNNTGGSGTETTNTRGGRWELGCGYYNKLGAKGFAEVYAGYSNGFFNKTNNLNAISNFDTRYLRPFLQPAFGFKLGQYFSLSGGFRATIVKFYNFSSPDSLLRYNIGNANQDIESNTYFFFEPFCNFEGGFKYIKGNVQIGASQQYNHAKITEDFPFYISFGVTLHFAPSFLKK